MNEKEPDYHPNVLIVEDYPATLNVLIARLQEDLPLAKFKGVDSIEAAKDHINNMFPDVIITDNQLGDGLGIDFIKWVRSHKQMDKIKVIAMSAAMNHDLRCQFCNCGAKICVNKPFEADDIRLMEYIIMKT